MRRANGVQAQENNGVTCSRDDGEAGEEQRRRDRGPCSHPWKCTRSRKKRRVHQRVLRRIIVNAGHLERCPIKLNYKPNLSFPPKRESRANCEALAPGCPLLLA